MKCSIDACENKAKYVNPPICQTHYHRMWRNGSYHLERKEARYITSNGYVVVSAPGHPLSRKSGYILEHRLVAYEKYNGSCPICEICGAQTSWDIYKFHVDHIDNNRQNNHPENLRLICNACNTKKDIDDDYYQKNGAFSLTINGKTMTARMWANQPGANFCSPSIKNRYKSGIPAWESVFGEKRTHKNKNSKKNLYND